MSSGCYPVLVLLAFTAAILATLAALQWMLTARDHRHITAPGTIVNGLHVHELGKGTPPVVLEAGLGASSLSWMLLQAQIAGFASTYSYDRAGFGWSTSIGSKPCRLEQRAQELYELTQTLKIPAPYILVAHSFGAYIVRHHAHHFPDQVAGVVLVDPLTPEEWINPTAEQRWRLRRAAFFTRIAGVLACFGVARFALWLLLKRKSDSPGPVSRFSTTLRRIRGELRKFPAEAVPLIRAHWSRPGFYWALAANLRDLPACAAVAVQCPIPASIPVTVLSGAQQPPQRLEEHLMLAKTSHYGRHLVYTSEHYMHLDQPELIANEVKKIAARFADRSDQRMEIESGAVNDL